MLDTTVPTLEGFNLPDLIDVSNGPAILSTYIDVDDDQSGISNAVVWFSDEFSYSISTTSPSYSSWSLMLLSDEVNTDRLVAANNRPGTYSVDRIELEDGQGNERTYQADELDALGFNTSFEIVGSTLDTTAPTLDDFTLPEIIDVSNGPAILSTYIDVDDDQSGISNAVVWFSDEFSYSISTTSPSYSSWSLMLLSDEVNTDRLVAANNRPGTYSVDRIELEDGQGNERTYQADELDALGFNTSFDIFSGLPSDTDPNAKLNLGDRIEVVEGTSITLPLMLRNLTNAEVNYQYSFSTEGASAESADFSGGSGQGVITVLSTSPVDRSVEIPLMALADNQNEGPEVVFLDVTVNGLVFSDGFATRRYEITILDNGRPTGMVEVSGRPLEGNTLSIETADVSDVDGLGPFSFQWLRDGSIVEGQTSDTYVITQNDVAARISAKATYTDGQGASETILSAATSAVQERFDVIGTDDANTLSGSTQAESLDGLGGNDNLSGGGDTDYLFGGEGHDFVYGDAFELRYALPEANQVFRLYQATFNRTPDEMGHKRWTSDLFTGESTLADVREGFVGSQEFRNKYANVDDATFVKQMYINVLDRDFDQGEVTQSEIDSWTNQISEAFTRADVVNGFAESKQLINNTLQAANKLAVESNPAAWSDDVYRLYQATLDRDPDIGGFTDWSDQLSEGRSLADVISGFTNSKEFANTYGVLTDPEDFVKLLYNNVLGRDFDLGEVSQSEITGWTEQLTETFTRANIVQGFSQSAEFTNKTAKDVKDWVQSQGVDDQIDGGAGTNTLSGGSLADQFVFQQTDASTNTVLDLETWDFLSFDGFGYSAESEALENMSQSGSSVVFSDQGTQVTFERFRLQDITDDMIIV